MTKLHRHEAQQWLDTVSTVQSHEVRHTDDGMNRPHRSDPWTPKAHTVYKHQCEV